MATFLKQHLSLSSVSSNCAPPAPRIYPLGPFFPPEFGHLENRASDLHISNQPAKRYDIIGAVVAEVEANEPLVPLIGK